MEVGADHVVEAGSLGAVGAVVAVAGAHRPEGCLACSQGGRAGMVLVAHDLAELRVEHHGADHPLGVALRGDVEDAEPRQAGALDGDEGVAEELVHAADHEHRGAPFGELAEPVADVLEVGLDAHLAGVLAPTTDQEVRIGGELAPGVVLVDHGAVAVATDPGGQAARVAEVAVDAHLARVQVDEVDHALASVLRARDARRSIGLARDGDVDVLKGLVAHWASSPMSGRS